MDYANGKIYMIEPTCEYEEGEVYYGSTTSTLVKRMTSHRKKANTCKSKILFEKYGKDNIKIVLVKLFPCQSKDELNAEEAKYQRENKCVNKNIAGRKKKQYRIDNSEKIKQYYLDNSEKNKQYQKNNSEKINARNRLRRAEKKSKSNI